MVQIFIKSMHKCDDSLFKNAINKDSYAAPLHNQLTCRSLWKSFFSPYGKEQNTTWNHETRCKSTCVKDEDKLTAKSSDWRSDLFVHQQRYENPRKKTKNDHRQFVYCWYGVGRKDAAKSRTQVASTIQHRRITVEPAYHALTDGDDSTNCCSTVMNSDQRREHLQPLSPCSTPHQRTSGLRPLSTDLQKTTRFSIS